MLYWYIYIIYNVCIIRKTSFSGLQNQRFNYTIRSVTLHKTSFIHTILYFWKCVVQRRWLNKGNTWMRWGFARFEQADEHVCLWYFANSPWVERDLYSAQWFHEHPPWLCMGLHYVFHINCIWNCLRNGRTANFTTQIEHPTVVY
jgi:hypothetical protein